jgi:hypothetical protein
MIRFEISIVIVVEAIIFEFSEVKIHSGYKFAPIS